MEQFDNVTIMKKANIYFDGKVTSRTVQFVDGSRKTLGVMLPGEYEFGTDAAEEMEMLAGQMEVMLPNGSVWLTVKAGDRFNVPASAKFKLKVSFVVDYCCSYAQ
jgi:uncharacterized protein YaiE (UPF0345 family)